MSTIKTFHINEFQHCYQMLQVHFYVCEYLWVSQLSTLKPHFVYCCLSFLPCVSKCKCLSTLLLFLNFTLILHKCFPPFFLHIVTAIISHLSLFPSLLNSAWQHLFLLNIFSWPSPSFNLILLLSRLTHRLLVSVCCINLFFLHRILFLTCDRKSFRLHTLAIISAKRSVSNLNEHPTLSFYFNLWIEQIHKHIK